MNAKQLEESAGFQELLDLIQRELDRRKSVDPRNRPNLEHELEQVSNRMTGLRESLANPKLAANVRQCLEADLGELLEREAGLKKKVQAEQQRPESARQLVDPDQVLERLERIDDVLHSGNPSEVNVELSHIVDRIECASDGTVTLRACPFGITPTALGLGLPSDLRAERDLVRQSQEADGTMRGTPRRRSIRRVEDRDAAHFVADPDRFRNVPESWFWIESFQQPKRKSWAATHAEEVHQMRFGVDGTVKATFKQLEKAFGHTKPTLAAALKIARETRRQHG